jgi:NADH-quinone oxidoreductase subunit G
MPKLTLNGEVYTVDSGKTIIEVADEVGVRIPRYCYHPDIGVEGSCRMCLIEAEGAPKLMPSCATPVRDGMVVRSDTPRVQEAVRYAMEFLLLHHPIDCPVCDQSGECWLQDYYMEMAGHESRFPLGEKTRKRKAFDLGPTVKLDQERCILCTRCSRFTENVTGTSEIQVMGRGHTSRIGVFEDKPLDNPYSINVVDICPVGALTSTDFRFKVRSWFLKGTASVCGGCSTGCNMRVDHSARPQGGGIPGYSATDGQVFRTVGRRNPDVNKSWLCDEGRLSFHEMENWTRTREARVGTKVQDLDTALATAHERFTTISQEHGDAAIAGLGSATNTNEALYLMKRYFNGRVDFRLDRETELVGEQQDDLLRRLDKHPNTRGAMDLDLESDLGGLDGMLKLARAGSLKAVWVSYHPQLVEADSGKVVEKLGQLIESTDFSVVSSPAECDWAQSASIRLPMAGWSEENGTYTNYSGRVQIANRAVATVGDIWPLHRLMARMLQLSGSDTSQNPEHIFDLIASQVPAYSGLDYDLIGPMGAQTRVGEAEEVAQ